MYGARGGGNIKGRELKFFLVTPDIKCNGKKVSANSVSNFLDFWPPLGLGLKNLKLAYDMSEDTSSDASADVLCRIILVY